MKWFKHQSDANMNAKLQELLLDYGLEGYGLYWYCLELIATNVAGEKLTFELEHDARVIARNTGSSVQRVQEMMNRLIELNLFEESGGNIFCLKLAKRCDDFTAKAIRNNEQKLLTKQSLRQSPTKSDKVPLEEEEEVRIEEEEEVRSKNIKTYVAKAPVTQKRFKPPVSQSIQQYMIERGLHFNQAHSESEKMHDFYESKGWMVGKNKMKCWKAATRNWLKNVSTDQRSSGPDMDSNGWIDELENTI